MSDTCWSDDAEFAPAMIALAVTEIDGREPVDEDIVLWRLLCVAWPTPRAQQH